MSTTTYDLITVGGGLGGASLAKAMAEHGAKVLVLERETQFKDRVRGEAVTPWGTAEAKKLGVYELLQATCGHELPWLDIYIGSTRIAHRDFLSTTVHQTPVYTFYHPSAQAALLRAAANVGAEVRRGSRVVNIRPGALPTVVAEQDGQSEEFQARLVVGADGRASVVRKWGNFPIQRDPEQLLVSGVLFETLPTSMDTTSLYFNPSIGQAMYLFPQRRDQVRAYIVHPTRTNCRLSGDEDLPRFSEEALKVGVPSELFSGAKAIGPLATFDGADNWVEHPYKDGIALIGDAAATSDPTWGEGISLTWRDARVLRDMLLRTNDWDAAGHTYATEHDRYYQTIHTIDHWFTQFFLETGTEADSRRARAFPLVANDATRMPDLFGLGPDATVNETVRRRFFGEE